MKVKVNDVELELSPGTSAIDAVFAAGYDVPYFCSQEYMSPIGACRMCLAKVGAPRKDRETGDWILDEETGEPKIFWFPNPMATCTTSIMEGMVVDTLGDEATKAQRGMVEMTLINHPLDCPTCDKGGACELQDRAYEYGSGESRFVFDKRHQEKHHALSEVITLDRERCIHCKRCVRYFEEVPSDEVLDFIERGGHTYIGTLDEGLPSNFTGNITDICPVGALLDTTSRFRGRNWEYDHTRSTSLDDCTGSAITIDARTGRIERIKAALNTQVNKSWIDDGIRFGHEYVSADDRITMPLLRKNGKLEAVTWEIASAFIAEKLKDVAPNDTGILIRADATLEEGFAAKSLAAHLNTKQLDHYPRPASSVIPTAPIATLEELATADAIFVLGDVTEEAPALDLRIKDALKGVAPAPLMPHGVPIADLRLKERMPRKRSILTVAAPYRVNLMRHAGRAVQYAAGQEARFIQVLADLNDGAKNLSAEDRNALGMTVTEARDFLKAFKDASNPVIVYGGFVLASPAATNSLNALAQALGAKVLAVGPMANNFGLEALAVLPEGNNGYATMLAGNVKALIVSGLDVAQDAQIAERLKATELLVVHDSFHNATTALADVVLPAKTGYEKDGTTVNLEGRYLPVNAAPVDGGLSEDLHGVVRNLGEAMGVRLEGRSLRSSRRALGNTLDLDLNAIPLEGVLRDAPAPAANTGTENDATGNVLLVPSMARTEYLSRNPHLRAAVGDSAIVMHSANAANANFKQHDVIRVNVGGITRRLSVRFNDDLPENLMLVPVLPEQPAGLSNVDLSQAELETIALEVA